VRKFQRAAGGENGRAKEEHRKRAAAAGAATTWKNTTINSSMRQSYRISSKPSPKKKHTTIRLLVVGADTGTRPVVLANALGL